MLVRHITRPHHVDSILKDGFLRREMCHSGTPRGKDIFSTMIKAQGGRLLWLTEEQFAFNSQQPGVAHKAFHFDTDTTPGLYAWRLVRSACINRSRKSEVAVLHMELTARACGDDPMRWWISRKDLSLDTCTNLDNLETVVIPPQNAEQTIQKVELLKSQATNKRLRALYDNNVTHANQMENHLRSLGWS